MGFTVTELLLIAITALLGGIAYFVKQILDRTTALESSFKPVTPALVEIQGKFKDAGHTILFPLTVTPGSPLKLTEYGKKLVHESGFDKLLQNCRDELVKRVKARKPKTNYDIQEESTALIAELLEGDDDMLKPIKDYAFNNGLDVKIIVPPAGLLLRDEVMKELTLD